MKDYSDSVPRAVAANMRFRKTLLVDAAKSRHTQLAVRRACEWSTLFFVNTFSWTYNPRKILTPKLPFITWPYQDRAFHELHDAIVKQEDVVIEKSRDMGASWICLMKFLHSWLFMPDTAYFMMSRVSDMVDSKGDINSLFGKIDFVLRHLPSWLISEEDYNRREMFLGNRRNGCTLTGVTTTGAAGVGGRCTAGFYDEMPLIAEAEQVWAQSADLTGCRILNGTPNGTNNTFYRVSRQEGIRKLSFHWSEHPEKVRGLYYDGAGKKRSTWYDAECKRRGYNKREIAAQLDIDYQGAAYQFFDAEEIERLESLHACNPYHTGDVACGRFVQNDGGLLQLWCHLSGGFRPERAKYTIGVDVAQGTGGPTATPSCLSVFCRDTGMKVAEYATPFLQPPALADKAKELGEWFYDASIIWEDIGPGTGFGARLIAIGYSNIYFRRNDRRISKDRLDVPGWYPTPEAKDMMLTEYRRALSAGEFMNRSKVALRECLQMVYDVSGHVTHSLSTRKDDPSGAKGNHADRVIADGLSWKLAQEYGTNVELQPSSNEPEVGSLLWRRQQREAGEKAKMFWQTRRER